MLRRLIPTADVDAGLAGMLSRNSPGSRTTILKRRSPSKTRPASVPPIAVAIRSCRGQAQASARDLPLFDIDVQKRETGRLLRLHALGGVDLEDEWRRNRRDLH